MRTIRVTGKGQIKVKPDMTRITITLEGLYPDYAETLRRFVGPPLYDSFRRYCGADHETALAMVDSYRERYAPIGA